MASVAPNSDVPPNTGEGPEFSPARSRIPAPARISRMVLVWRLATGRLAGRHWLTTMRRGTPNWCKPQAMRSRPAVPSSFEEVVEDIAGAEGMGAKKQESE